MKKLYKLDARNDLLFWKIHVIDTRVIINWGRLERTSAGFKEGKTQEQVEICDDAMDAESRMWSRINKQKNRLGYTEHVPSTKPLSPMLAQTYDKDKHYDWPDGFLIQPKLDGFRCIGTKDKLISRRNTVIKSVPRIQQALALLPEGIKLDGELYLHGTDFELLQSWIKRDFPIQGHEFIEYHVYDMIDTEMPYSKRLKAIHEIVHNLHHPLIKVVGTSSFCSSINDPDISFLLSNECKIFEESRYEGIMIRNPDGVYEINKRSNNLLKYKNFMDHEFQIVNVEEGANECGVFVCKTEAGAIFNVSPAWTKERKQVLWKFRENYIGKWLKVKFLNWTNTIQPVPRHPTGITIVEAPNVDSSSKSEQ